MIPARAPGGRWAPGALALLALVLAPGVARGENLLSTLRPTRSGGTSAPARITDGQAPPDGSPWNAPGAASIPAGATLQWDLGQVRAIWGAALQGDNNDDYVLSVSEDEHDWTPLFSAGPVGEPGLQTRSVGGLGARGRYVRLEPRGGDGRYSVSEVELFADQASFGASHLLSWRWLPQGRLARLWMASLGAAALLLFAARAGQRRWVAAAIATLLTGLGAILIWRTIAARPSISTAELNALRACVAALALVAVLRAALLRRRHPEAPRLVTATLAFTALAGVVCFLNVVRPQFHDRGRHQPTYLHLYDMRTYYPLAKYLRELSFDGVYAASTAVVADERGLDALSSQGLRDLRNQRTTTVGEVAEHVREVKARFSPERWQTFRDDMAYFRAGMGDGDFLESMHDHGGNATPVWLVTANLLFRWGRASDAVLWLAVLLDVALLLAAFVALGRAFGTRTALVAATVFGAMDFYMFGSNWFGAGLRHDWLSLWCLGVAALKRERHALGGALLAWAALIRAFPALAFVTLAMPVLWRTLGDLVRARGRFDARAWLAGNRPVVRAALGAAAWGAVLFTVASLMFGVGSWAAWLRKVAMLNEANHINNLAVKTYVTATHGGWIGFVVAASLVLFVAVRKLGPAEAAAAGVMLIPVVFNPANYYLHVVCVLAALGAAQGARSVHWLLLLAMCSASYFTSLSGDTATHFRQDTGVLLVALGGVVVVELARPLAPFLQRLRSRHAAPPHQAPTPALQTE